MADVKVKPNDKTKIVWANSPYHKRGAAEELHPVQAQKMIEKGYAVKEGEDLPPVNAVLSARPGHQPLTASSIADAVIDKVKSMGPQMPGEEEAAETDEAKKTRLDKEAEELTKGDGKDGAKGKNK